MYQSASQVLPMADEVWLISHSESSGRPRLAVDHIAIGLAGAILAELLLVGAIVLAEAEHVFLRPDRGQQIDPVTGWALAEIGRNRASAPLQRWTTHLADEARPRVAKRLSDAGMMDFVRAGVFGAKRRPVPRDVNLAASPRVRMLYQLGSGEYDIQTAMLCALTVTMGLDHLVMRDLGRRETRETLVAVGRRLPADFRAIANAVNNTITHATMSIRR